MLPRTEAWTDVQGCNPRDLGHDPEHCGLECHAALTRRPGKGASHPRTGFRVCRAPRDTSQVELTRQVPTRCFPRLAASTKGCALMETRE